MGFAGEMFHAVCRIFRDDDSFASGVNRGASSEAV